MAEFKDIPVRFDDAIEPGQIAIIVPSIEYVAERPRDRGSHLRIAERAIEP